MSHSAKLNVSAKINVFSSRKETNTATETAGDEPLSFAEWQVCYTNIAPPPYDKENENLAAWRSVRSEPKPSPVGSKVASNRRVLQAKHRVPRNEADEVLAVFAAQNLDTSSTTVMVPLLPLEKAHEEYAPRGYAQNSPFSQNL